MSRPSRGEISRARSLIRQVILAQNNIYIRELLREKGQRIGGTKEEFEENLNNAINSGAITYAELTAWVAEVEGWGDEHVYLYTVPDRLANDRVWRETSLVEARVKAAGLGKHWNADASLAFPKARKLTGIYFKEGELTCVWQQGAEAEVRVPSKDYTAEIDGDIYLFKASRQYGKRAVTRLVLRPSAKIAAVFLPASYDPDSHGDELQALGREIAPIIHISELPRFSVSEAIKILDALVTTTNPPADLQAPNTKLSGGGASVEFSSATASSYSDYEPIRNVRRAVEASKFVGSVADFRFRKSSVNKLSRDIRVQLHGNQSRIRLYMRMTNADVWTILTRIVTSK
jgi:hypothetical protein